MAARLTRTLATVRAATTLARTRPAYAAGVRAAVATVGPLFVATLLGNAGGTWLSLGGFNAALADKGGSYRDRAFAMAAVMVGSALAVLLGSLGGHHLWMAVPLTFAFAFVACLARVWGAAGASVGGASLSTFVIALAYPAASVGEAFTRSGYAVVGGGWAILVALVLWPLRPYRPARLAVAACYRALAELLDEVVATMSRATEESRPEVPVGSATVRAALEGARAVLTQLRRGRPGSSGRGEHLVVLGDTSDQLFGHAIAVTEAVEAIAPARRDAAAQLLVLEALAMIATTSRALARAVESEADFVPVPIGWDGAALRALVTARQASGGDDHEASLHYLHAASILDRAARFAEAASASAAALSRGPGGTAEFPIPDDAPAQRSGPDALTLLRAILTPESVILRYATRVAVVTAIAVLLTGLQSLNHGYWMTITVIVIMQPYTGLTTHRALQRVLGTVLGGLLTALLGTAFHAPSAILVLSFIFAATCVALMPLNYAAYSVFLTPTFVLLAEASAGDWSLAKTRVINTVLGGALAFAGSRLLWPSPETRRLPGYMSAALRANAGYLRCVGVLFGDRSDAAGEQLRAARRAIGLALVNAEESFQRLIGEHGGAEGALAPAISFLTYTRRFTASTTSLALARHTLPQEFAAAVGSFTVLAGGVLDELADAVASRRAPAPLPMLTSFDDEHAPLPPLLRVRTERLGRQLRVLHQSVERYVAMEAAAERQKGAP